MHGSPSELYPQLLELNKEEFGIFVCGNPMDGRGAKAANVIGVRCIWQNDTHGFKSDYPLPPSIVVANELGECQRVWLTSEPLGKREFLTVQRTLVKAYGSDKTAVDLGGLLQVPGFSTGHPLPFSTDLVEASGEMYSREALLRAFLPTDQLLPLLGPNPTLPPTAEEILFIKATLRTLSPNSLKERVGLILHGIFDGQEEGFEFWVGWIVGWMGLPHESEFHEYSDRWARWGQADSLKLGTEDLLQLIREHPRDDFFPAAMPEAPFAKRTLH